MDLAAIDLAGEGVVSGVCHRRASWANWRLVHSPDAGRGLADRLSDGDGRGHRRRPLWRGRRLWADGHLRNTGGATGRHSRGRRVLLCYLGLRTLLAKPALEAASARRGRGLLGAYVSTVGLTLTNPATIVSFATVFAALGLVGASGSAVAAPGLLTARRVSRLGVLVAAAQRRREPVTRPADGRRAALGESGVGHPAAGLWRGGGGQRRHGALALLPAVNAPVMPSLDVGGREGVRIHVPRREYIIALGETAAAL